jgi:hypothetical protein
MDGPQRCREPVEVVALTQAGRERIAAVADPGQGVGVIEHDPDAFLDVPGRDVLGRRVDRDEFRREFGSLAGLVRTEQLALRVRELALPLEGRDLAGEHAVAARAQLPFPELHLVEEGERQRGTAVGHRHFEQPAAAGPHRPGRHLGDLGENGDMLAFAQGRQVGQLAPLGVPARVVPQQIARGAQAEGLFQFGGGFAPHHTPQRFFQARHGLTG